MNSEFCPTHELANIQFPNNFTIKHQTKSMISNVYQVKVKDLSHIENETFGDVLKI